MDAGVDGRAARAVGERRRRAVLRRLHAIVIRRPADCLYRTSTGAAVLEDRIWKDVGAVLPAITARRSVGGVGAPNAVQVAGGEVRGGKAEVRVGGHLGPVDGV